uniref:Uncharacterized protein n=1 Tax=Nelumbo nucifera TaxID=4432 RepID=A0A822ZBX4_NELNU|nr:TPA_asm: hypothetical protein HUJ06_000263 [Nelumbo nucifera]
MWSGGGLNYFYDGVETNDFPSIFLKPTERSIKDKIHVELLISLGLQNYENFKKGLLTDSTLPLPTDSALRDATIPPGPRLLILNRIQRETVVCFLHHMGLLPLNLIHVLWVDPEISI